MATWLKILLIVILAVHYALAIFVVFLVLKDNLNSGNKINKAKLIVWDLVVLLLPIVGPIIYLVYRFIAKPYTKIQTFAPSTPENIEILDGSDTVEEKLDGQVEEKIEEPVEDTPKLKDKDN